MEMTIVTKRMTLALSASVFDSLGIIGPITVTAKIILQDVCLLKLGWDQMCYQMNYNVDGRIYELISDNCI